MRRPSSAPPSGGADRRRLRPSHGPPAGCSARRRWASEWTLQDRRLRRRVRPRPARPFQNDGFAGGGGGDVAT